MKLRVLDLFSGIGGFSLGLERTGGFETVAFCEIEDYPRRVLAKHWPGVPIYHDVRELTADTLRRDEIAVDVICGGFPCQDISTAGKRAGLEGARSGLWGEYWRLIGELRPRYVLVENVANLLGLGLGRVLGDLATIGYDAAWDCIPASALGAPHQRDRLWLIGHPSGVQGHGGDLYGRGYPQGPGPDEDLSELGDMRSGDVADTHGAGLEVWEGVSSHNGAQRPPTLRSGWWSSEPDVGRVAHGVPSRVDRLKGLGNAVVPQIPELIGRAILKAEGLA